MTECTCPEDQRSVPSDRRMTVFLPGAEVRAGNSIQRDASKVFIFDKECPKHGWTEVPDE